MKGELGACKTGSLSQVSSFGPHYGEEAPLSGWKGSGTIFFTNCNLHCCYCQNYDISQKGTGSEVQPEELAGMMLKLKDMGCHNINLVSPTHVIPQILAAVFIAAQAGLDLPVVYNSGGYDSSDSLALLDGIVDIYMPDMKYSNEVIARKYSKIPDYPRINRMALHEMSRQVGDLQLDEIGIAFRGLLVRHLVLPNDLAGSKEILRFLAEEISPNTYLNLMDQYRPCYQAGQFPELNRRVTHEEFLEVYQLAKQFGLYRLDR